MKKSLLYVYVLIAWTIIFSPVSSFGQKNIVAVAGASKPNSPTKKTSEARVPSAAEKAVLDEINLARREPKKYIKYLEEYKKLFQGRTVFLPDFLRIETNEGAAAVEEAINYLKNVLPLDAYDFSNGLNKTAAVQLKDLIADSKVGHTGRDGSDLTIRLHRVGRVGTIYSENIAYYAETARDIVMMMIIDDGVKSRAHRKNVFSPNFKIVGIAFGKGKTNEGICVVDFADALSESNTKTGVQAF